jgi:hypothetical protein
VFVVVLSCHILKEKENKSDFSLGFLIVIARGNNKILQVFIFPQKRNNIQIFKNVKFK